jgi:hypothetical protein
MNKTYKGMINVDRYFKAYSDGVDYEFQSQLTDDLLTEILRANERIIELDDTLDGIYKKLFEKDNENE